MKNAAAALVLFLLSLSLGFSQADGNVPKTFLPLPLLREIINEVSGDLALQNEIILSGVKRNRRPDEYTQGYFETKFVLERLREYGIPDAEIITLPWSEEKTWDAEMGELWIVGPAPQKIADLEDFMKYLEKLGMVEIRKK
ncbi:MAG: hypothetical protein AB1715_07970 [Acidobacteriota bacterium]